MPAQKKYATVLAEDSISYAAELADKATLVDLKTVDLQTAHVARRRAVDYKQSIETDATHGIEVDPAHHATTLSAITLADARIARATDELEQAQRQHDGRSSSTWLAEKVAEAITPALPDAQVLCTANPRHPEPAGSERLAVVVVQTHAGSQSATGEIIGEVVVHFYRTSLHIPISKNVVREIIAGLPGSSTKLVCDSQVKESGLVSKATLQVRVAPDGLPTFEAIAPRAEHNLGYELEDAIAAFMHSDADPYVGSPRENCRIRFAARRSEITSEVPVGDTRELSVTVELLAQFKTNSSRQQPLDMVRTLVNLLRGSFIPGLGRVVDLTVNHAPPSESPAGMIPGPGHDEPGRYVVEAVILSALPDMATAG